MNKKTLKIELPWAPTVNTFLRHFVLPLKNDKYRACTTISKKGKEFYAEIDKILEKENYPKIAGPLFVFIELYPPDHRTIDIDNRNKPILDSLKYRPRDKHQTLDAWVFADDDSQVKCLLTVMLNIVSKGKVVVTLKQIDPHDFFKRIRMLLLDDDCPGPDGKIKIPEFSYDQRTLFDG